MREIKFRAWDKKRKHWASYCTVYENGEYEIGEMDGDEVDPWLDAEAELMQFTGLHDKNGKEIYEGDIIQEYLEAACVSKFQKPYEIKWDINCFNVPRMSWLCEVIGNVFEDKI